MICKDWAKLSKEEQKQLFAAAITAAQKRRPTSLKVKRLKNH